MSEDWLSIQDVAARLAVSQRTVRSWLQRGVLTGYKFGGWRGEWRVKPEDLDKFVADSKNRQT